MKKIYQSFWQISLVLGVILFASQTQALDCTPVPDCGTLGYSKTEADCQGADVVLKCPYNTKQVTCLPVQLLAGDILYGDGTVSSEVIAGKKPIGVVFDAENRLAVALTDVKQDGSAGSEEMMWSSEECDVPYLKSCGRNEASSCEIDGKRNTYFILATNGGCSGTTYAANAVNAYNPSNCSKDFCKAGEWFLPSMRDLNTLYLFRNMVNSTLESLIPAGAQRQSVYYWSSNESTSPKAWKISMSNGWLSFLNKSYTTNVRPVIAF